MTQPMFKRYLLLLSIPLAIAVLGAQIGAIAGVDASANGLRTQGVLPVDVELAPSSLWSVAVQGNIVVAVRGNGFAGPVTISFGGLPDNQAWNCDSECDPGLGSAQYGSRSSYSMAVGNGEWRSFSPQVFVPRGFPGDPPADYTVSVTVSAAGYSSVVKTFNLRVEPSLGNAEIQIYAPQGFALWAPEGNKQTVTAGGRVTFSGTFQIGGDVSAWVNGTDVTYYSNGGSNPYGSVGITTGFSPSHQVFNQGDRQPFVFSVQTSPTTPPGVYVYSLGMPGAGGLRTSVIEGVVTVRAAAPPPSSPPPSPSPSSTPTPTGTVTSTATPTPSSSSESGGVPPAEPAISSGPPPSTTPSGESPAPLLPAVPSLHTTTALVETVTDQVLVPAAFVSTAMSVITFGTLGGATTTATLGIVSLWANMVLGLWNILLETLGLRRRRYPWGTVFDTKNDRPVEFAIVRLKAEDGRLVETRVTDRFGRYGFLPQPGQYSLEVTKPDYELDRSMVAKGSLYQPVWNLKPIAIIGKTKTLHANIPLTATRRGFHSPLALLTILHRPALLISLLLVAWNVTVRPTGTSWTLIAVVGVMLVAEWLLGHPRDYGRVTDSKGVPIASLPIRLLRTEDRKVVATQLTDAAGSYSFLALPGSYEIALGSSEWQCIRPPVPQVVTDELGSLVAPSLHLRPVKDGKWV